MKKLKKFLKGNIKVLVALMIGATLAGTGVYAATVIVGSNVGYSNTNSGLSATTVQEAIDELYVTTQSRYNIVEGYTYNSTVNATNYCVTGEESTCVKTTCYKETTAGSCPAGTIVKYKVNDDTEEVFNVLYDEGITMTMQHAVNTVNNSPWYSSIDTTFGPTTSFNALQNATSEWTNVIPQKIIMGSTVFKTNNFTGCSSVSTCDSNLYTWEQKTANARMITVQEAYSFNCAMFGDYNPCPMWLRGDSTGYWTMNASSSGASYFISETLNSREASAGKYLRAVIVVAK